MPSADPFRGRRRRRPGAPAPGGVEIRSACEEVAAGMARVGTTVPEKNGVADAIAARGRRLASLGPGGDVTGLSRPAERPRSEATGFLGGMRR